MLGGLLGAGDSAISRVGGMQSGRGLKSTNAGSIFSSFISQHWSVKGINSVNLAASMEVSNLLFSLPCAKMMT